MDRVMTPEGTQNDTNHLLLNKHDGCIYRFWWIFNRWSIHGSNNGVLFSNIWEYKGPDTSYDATP